MIRRGMCIFGTKQLRSTEEFVMISGTGIILLKYRVSSCKATYSFVGTIGKSVSTNFGNRCFHTTFVFGH